MTKHHASHLLVHPIAPTGEYIHVTPETAGWDHLHFAARRIPSGEIWGGQTGEHEYGLVILGGVCVVQSSRGLWEGVGRRPDVFHGMPYALYLPRHTDFTVTVPHGEVDIACGWCRTEQDHPPRLV